MKFDLVLAAGGPNPGVPHQSHGTVWSVVIGVVLMSIVGGYMLVMRSRKK